MREGLKKEDSAALKGIAILMMVFHHCYRTEKKFAGYEILFTPFTAENVIHLALYMKICVCIFAFVSGYGLMYGYLRNQNPDNRISDSAFVKRHLFSTCSGYWFLVVPAYLVYGVRNGFSYGKWGTTLWEKIAGILTDALGLSEILGTKSVNGAWWYMGAAITFIILVPVLGQVILKMGSLTCIGLVFILPRLLNIGFQGGRSPLSFLMALVVGMVCCKKDVFARFHSWVPFGSRYAGGFLKFVLLAALVLWGYQSYRLLPFSYCWEYQFALIPFILILFLKEYVFRIPGLKRLLGFLGKHSLNIWLVHTFVRDYLKSYLWSLKYFALVPLAILLISLVLSVVINALKKYTGYDGLIRKISRSFV